MAETSRRAARAEARGGRPNALFVVAAAEAPPAELRGRGDLVTVRFPWGSLLRGMVGLEPAASAGLASLVAPGGELEALVSIHPRDGLAEIGARLADPSELGRAWAAHGLTLVESRTADRIEVAATRSSWARRLGATASDGRVATRVRLVRLP